MSSEQRTARETLIEWGDAVAAIHGWPGAPSAFAVERLISAGDCLAAALRAAPAPFSTVVELNGKPTHPTCAMFDRCAGAEITDEAMRPPPLWRHAVNECNDAHAALDAAGAPKTKTVRRLETSRMHETQEMTMGLAERIRAIQPANIPAPAPEGETWPIGLVRQRVSAFNEGYRAGYARGEAGEGEDLDNAWDRSKTSAEMTAPASPGPTPEGES
jgi:hypothetical protein